MKRTFVFSNLAISLDGKIATTSRKHFPLGSKKDLLLMRKLRNQADAVIMGAETLRSWKRPCLPLQKNKIWNTVVSRKLDDIDPNWKFFKSNRIRRLLLVSSPIQAARRKAFEKSSTIVYLKRATSVASQIIQAHQKLGLSRLIIEGGGGLMSEFVKENRIDQYFVTLTPRLLGGKSAPTLVDGAGLSMDRVLNLKLQKIEKVGSEVFLVYGKLEKRGKKHPLYSE